MDSFIDQSDNDIQEDYLILNYLVDQYIDKLLANRRLLDKIKKMSVPDAYGAAKYAYNQVLEQLETIKQISNTAKKARSKSRLTQTFITYIQLYEQVRGMASLISGTLPMIDSQSPSFFSSTFSQAGRYTNKIIQSYNDYFRDQHGEGSLYEKRFFKEYIDIPLQANFYTYLTNSGMAALTTIAGFIQGNTDNSRPILVGKSCYFEEKILLKTLFSNRVIEIDESDIQSICLLVKDKQPSAIFLDSLSNSSTVFLLNSFSLLRELKKIINFPCFIVIDNTALSITFQPFARSFFSHKHVHLIVWESLLKHHQFGLDRVNAGIIYTNSPSGINIYTYRDHLGTNISDMQSFALPYPNRKFLNNRLLRHERNAVLITQILTEKIEKENTKIETVVTPTQPNHVSSNWSKEYRFHGAYITLRFKEKYRSLKEYKNFLHSVFDKAAKKNIPLIGGTSFGFPITRVYIPASRPGQGIPFVRIAVGTEPFKNSMAVAELLSEAIS